jgi:Flp pilus assembly protein TadG
MRSDRGSTTLELVVWAPVLLLIMSVIIYAGRVAQAQQTVQAAAVEAARAASAASDRHQAGIRARAAATAAMTSAGLRCGGSTVAVDTGQWELPAGRAGTVTATIACDVSLQDLIAPGIPGNRSVRAEASSVLDTYRERS